MTTIGSLKRFYLDNPLICVLCMSLFFIFGCSSDSSVPISQGEDRGWFWHHELTAGSDKVATNLHTVVIHAQNNQQILGSPSTMNIPYRFQMPGKHRYCIDKDDPLFINLRINTTTGVNLASLKQGECIENEFSQGDYIFIVETKSSGLNEKGILGFIGSPKKYRLIQKGVGKDNSAFHNLTSGKVALIDDKGNLITLSPSTPLGQKEAYYLVATPLSTKRAITKDDLFTFSYDNQNRAYKVSSSKGLLGGYAPISCEGSDCPIVKDTGYSSCKIDSTVTQSPIYTYSAEHQGTPPAQFFRLSETGNSSFILSLSDSRFQRGFVPLQTLPDGTACFFDDNRGNRSVNSTFTVFLRYFENIADVPEPQEGEVLLFSGTNYTGSAWLFSKDVPDFSVIQGLKSNVLSVKTGPNTKVFLSNVPNSKDLTNRIYIGQSIDDLTKTSVGNAASALYISPNVTQITLSASSCRYCDLRGIQIPRGFDLEPFKDPSQALDFTGALFSNASFLNAAIRTVNFTDAIMTGVTFKEDAYIPTTQYSNIDFTNATLDNSNLIGLKGVRIYMDNITLKGVSMKGANFYYANLTMKSLVGADLSGTIATSTVMNCTNWSGCLYESGQPKIKVNNAVIDYDWTRSGFVMDLLVNDSISNSRYLDLRGATLKGPYLWTVPIYGAKDPAGYAGNADFTGAVFPDGMDFSKITQPCADMTNLKGCMILDSITANSANFKEAVLKGVSFNKASLQKADFSRAVLTGAVMTGTNLTDAIFQASSVYNANMRGANLCRARFDKDTVRQVSAALDGSYLSNANLSYANLSGVSMQDVSFNSTISRATCTPDTNCNVSSCASAYKAIMTNANLTGAYLAGLDMSGASLNGALFLNSFAIGVNFTNSDLSADPSSGVSANFTNALLFGANFTNAKVQGVRFSNAHFDDPTRQPPAGIVVSYLDNNYTNFTNSPFLGVYVCPQYALSYLNVFPATDSTVTCPDTGSGPCSGSRWVVASPDPAKIMITYGSSSIQSPAGCNGKVYLFW